MPKTTLSRLLMIVLAAAFLALAGCSGDDGAPGAPGAPGTSTGTVTGTVTNGTTNTAEAGVTVTAAPSGTSTTTGTDGTYTLADLPIGVYTLTFTKTGFTTQTVQDISVVAGATRTEDLTIQAADPNNPGVIAVSTPTTDDNGSTIAPGSSVTLAATITPPAGTTVTGIQWTQSNSVEVTLQNDTTETPTVVLPDTAAYKDELINVLREPPIDEDQLPEGVTLPDGTIIPEGLQDRFQVQGLTHFDLEEAGLVTVRGTVTLSNGDTYHQDVPIQAHLPWRANGGIRTVAVNEAVLIHGGTQGGTQTSWSWSLAPPGGSTAALDDATAQNPSFTPDTSGTYTLAEANSGATIEVMAANWVGAITGQDANGRPVADNCTICHREGGFAPDKFTPWAQSGHAEIFTNNLNTSTHYGESCFECHTVGYNPAASNNGSDDQSDYDDFLASGLLNNPGDNWTTMLDEFPNTARMANIQCENCHGPNGTGGGHAQVAGGNPSRISLGSEVCGRCHGEPPRHGRNLQWQVSPHANYELAIDEGTSSNCARCHTANGFVAWEDLDFDAGASVNVTWTTDEIHPQTCTACHDPHDPGNISGEPNNAKVRVENDTPVLAAGFRVLNAGRGAICMVCHNTRRDLRNDDEGAGDVVTAGRAPHGGAQADVLMGQNAFFVQVGVRGKHSLITDTCANCHMEQTPPPALLSYALGGTNHTFYASKDICSRCHNSITADEVQSATMTQLSFLQTSLEDKLAEMIVAYAATPGLTVTLTGQTDAAGNALADVGVAAGDTVVVENFADSHGRQAVDITVNGGTTGHLQLRNIVVNDGVTDLNIMTYLADNENGPGELLAKAGWNFLMATNERSKGIHNNAFSLQIIAGAQSAVDSITP
jgi:hypothetical protein